MQTHRPMKTPSPKTSFSRLLSVVVVSSLIALAQNTSAQTYVLTDLDYATDTNAAAWMPLPGIVWPITNTSIVVSPANAPYPFYKVKADYYVQP